MTKDSYLYPAIFKYGEDGITITFPDLPGCISCGKNDEEAQCALYGNSFKQAFAKKYSHYEFISR